MSQQFLRCAPALLALLTFHHALALDASAAEPFVDSEANVFSSIVPVVWESGATTGTEPRSRIVCPPLYEDGSPHVLFNWHSGEDKRPAFDPDEPLTTDRPDFTEASITVGRGVTQVEMGYTYFYNSDDGESTRLQSFGEPLFRHGIIANWLELRVAVFPVEERTRVAGTSNSTAGMADMLVGLKFGLTAQDGILPEMAIVPQMILPTGSNNFTDEEVLPGVNWLYGWDINDDISTGGSTQFLSAVDGETDDMFTLWAQSWTVGVKLTEKVGSYIEWFGLFPASAETERTEHYLNGGLTWLITDDIQWDIRVGTGLNHAANDLFTGTGLSIRWK